MLCGQQVWATHAARSAGERQARASRLAAVAHLNALGITFAIGRSSCSPLCSHYRGPRRAEAMNEPTRDADALTAFDLEILDVVLDELGGRRRALTTKDVY